MNSLDILARAVSLSRANSTTKETPYVSRSLYPQRNFLGLHYNDHSYSCKAIGNTGSLRLDYEIQSENLAYTSSSDDSDSEDSSSVPRGQRKVQGTAADHSYSEFKFRIRCRCQSRHRFGSLLMCDYCGYSQHKNCIATKDLFRRPYFCYKCLYSSSEDLVAHELEEIKNPLNADEDIHRLKHRKLVRRFKKKSKHPEHRRDGKQSELDDIDGKDDESEWAITSTVDINSNDRKKSSQPSSAARKRSENEQSLSISPDSTTCPKMEPSFNHESQKRKQSTPKKANSSTSIKLQLNSPLCGRKRKRASEPTYKKAQGEPAKKLTREEKKVQHYMKIFEQMEKKQKSKRSPRKSTGSDVEFQRDDITNFEAEFGNNETGDTTVSSTTEISDQTSSSFGNGSSNQNSGRDQERPPIKESNTSSDDNEKTGITDNIPENDNLLIDFSKMQFKKPLQERRKSSSGVRGRGKKITKVSQLALNSKPALGANRKIPDNNVRPVIKDEPEEVQVEKGVPVEEPISAIKNEIEFGEKVVILEQSSNESTSSSGSSSSSSSSCSESEDDEKDQKEIKVSPEIKNSTAENIKIHDSPQKSMEPDKQDEIEKIKSAENADVKPPTLNVAKSLKAAIKRRDKAKRSKLKQDSSKLVLAKYQHRYAPTPRSRYQTRASQLKEDNQRIEATCKAIETNTSVSSKVNDNKSLINHMMLPDQQKRVQSTSVKCIKMKKMLLNEWLSEQALENTEKQAKMVPEPVVNGADSKAMSRNDDGLKHSSSLSRDITPCGDTYIASAKKRWLQKAIESSYSDALSETSHLCNNIAMDVNTNTAVTRFLSDPGRDESLENVFFEPPVCTKKKVSLLEYKKRREDEGLSFRRTESAENPPADCQSSDGAFAKELKPLPMPLEAIKNRAHGFEKVCKMETLNDRKKIMQENVKRELEKMKLRHVGKDGIENLRRELEQEKPRHFSGSDIDSSPMRQRTPGVNQTLAPVQIQPSYCLPDKCPQKPPKAENPKVEKHAATASGAENVDNAKLVRSDRDDVSVPAKERVSKLNVAVTNVSQKDDSPAKVGPVSVKKKKKRKHLHSKSPPPPPPPPPRPSIGFGAVAANLNIPHALTPDKLDEKEFFTLSQNICKSSSVNSAAVVTIETPNPMLGRLPFIQNSVQPESLQAQQNAPQVPIPLIIQSIPSQQTLVLRSGNDLS